MNVDQIKKQIVKNYFSLMRDNHFEEIRGIKVEDESRVAICFYANKKYIDGLRVAISSLKKNNKNIPTIILFSDDIEEKPNGVNRLIKIDIEDYRYLEMFPDLPNNTWPKSIFYKLSIFNIYGYDRIIFVDSDMLVIRDISDLWDLDKYNEFDFYATYTAPQQVGTGENHKDNLCSALMVINKNLLNVQVYKKLIGLAVLHKTYDGSDQGVINYYLRKNFIRYGMIRQSYNTYPRDKFISKCKVYDEPARILHFTGGHKKFTSWHDRINQKIFDEKYINLYYEYYKD
jgi:lipopolysaccharide biosynthesis glycosyltransferase